MLTTSEVCERAKVTRQTLSRWCRAGLCPAPVKLGPRCLRFRREAIDNWLSAGGVRSHVAGVVGFDSAWLPGDDRMADAETAAEVASDETE